MSEHQYTKPLPDVDDPVSAPFWAAARRHELSFQRCDACGAFRWHPDLLCPECQAIGGEWTVVSPTGMLYSYATYHRAFDPRFKEDLPYTVGLIRTEAGPALYGKLLGDIATYTIDGSVRAVFEDVTPEVTLIRWTAAE